MEEYTKAYLLLQCEADVEISNTMVSKKDRKRVLVEFNLIC
jgi:hypothetical protein